MKVKLCGMTHLDDAECAMRLGTDYIGIIFADQSRRKVSVSDAKKMANIANQSGVEPVAVFVDESVERIIEICKETGIKTVQLHGEKPQHDLELLLGMFSIIYALPVMQNGEILKSRILPPQVICLYDNVKGVSGAPFNWRAFTPLGTNRWILAGGLNPDNVIEAINLLNPFGVDVASGIEYPGSTRKDPKLMNAFIHNARHAKERL